MSFKLPSPEGYFDFVRSTADPLTAMMAELPVVRQEEIWNKVADASKKFAGADGKPSFTNEVIYISAMK